jgi:iron complex transport system substrate-binding protein
LPVDSAAIDRDVRAALKDALTIYTLDVEGLAELAPDVVVTQDLCDVCAVSLPDVQAALAQIAGDGITLVSLHPTRFGDLFTDLQRLGSATGRETEADAAIAQLRRRVEAVTARADALTDRPRVLTIEWIDPVMVGGTWMPELVEMAGGEALVTKPGEHAPTLDSAALAALDPGPDVVLIKPCGFTMERSIAEWDTLVAALKKLPWPAVERGALFLADGNAYFNRPGPRLVESLEIMAACVHPETFDDFAQTHRHAFQRIDLERG